MTPKQERAEQIKHVEAAYRRGDITAADLLTVASSIRKTQTKFENAERK